MNTSASLPDLDFSTLFPFELDNFQQEAIAALEAGRSIVVCAPTGSGKTLIGEYAIYRALARGRRVFYTTPLKALSNQKLRDFRTRFGVERVGLLTGDVSINRDAPILVMTTEIFRNMLYGTPIGEVGVSLTGVEVVVLDECHYMNDRQRGTVWEESIIYCPPEIQLVALSATVANSDQLTDWIGQIHGPTDLIYSEVRPVPLQIHFCDAKGLFPLLNKDQTKINPQLGRRSRVSSRPGRGSRAPSDRKSRQSEAISLGYILSQLRQRDMLPAIYFIFSRRGCDQAVAEVGHINLVNQAEAQQLKLQVDQFLARNPEAVRPGQLEPLYRGIAAHHAGVLPAWKGFVEELFQQGLIKVVFATETLAAGINMPARTTVISSLSKRTDRGHRLLSPSEFLQMAGRAGRRGMDRLGYVVTVQTPFEGAREAAYLATAGSDPLVSQFTPSYGMVLNLLQTHTLEEAKDLIERSFGYYLATVHLAPQRQAIADLSTELTQAQAKLASVDLKSLGSYQKLRERLKEEQRLLKILQQQADEVRASELAVVVPFAVPGTLLSLKRDTQHSSPKGKDAERLRQGDTSFEDAGTRGTGESATRPNRDTGNFQSSLHPGQSPSPGSLNGYPKSLSAVLVTKMPGSGQFPYLVCLGQDNRWYVATLTDILGFHADLPSLGEIDTLVPPAEMPLKPGQSRSGTGVTQAVSQKIPHLTLDLEPEVLTQLKRVEAVQAQLESHPAHQWKNHSALLKLQRRTTYLQEQIASRQTKLHYQSGRHWEEFLRLIQILQSFGALKNLTPTALGQAAAATRGDNELWLSLALMSGELDGLDPHHLGAACAALVTELSRSDSWIRYPVSDSVEAALAGLRPLRRQLFQLQRRQDIVLPIWLELEVTGLLEQWALGANWLDICANTSLDEGDIVRILRRTLDFLSQIPYIPHLPKELSQNAYRAVQLINRFPVSEVL